MGYMEGDEEEKKDSVGQMPGGAGKVPAVGEIRKRQQSCYIKDLKPDEVPEFWKSNFENGKASQPKPSIKEIIKKVVKILINKCYRIKTMSLSKDIRRHS